MSKAKNDFPTYNSVEEATANNSRDTGTFAEIRAMIKENVPKGMICLVVDVTRVMMTQRSWDYRKAYNYTRNAVIKHPDFTLDRGVITRVR